jgi:hypothetical protein
LLELSDLPLLPQQHKDGVSLVPLIKGEAMSSRPFYWHYPHYGNQGGQPSSVVREGTWKLIHYWEDGRSELYDLSSDPNERTDRGEAHPMVRDSLELKLFRFLEDNNAKFAKPDPEYDSLKALERRSYLQTELFMNLEEERKQMLEADYSPNPTWWGSQPSEE